MPPGRRALEAIEIGFHHRFLGRSEARKEIEVKDKSVAFAAFGGERFALVLEFNLLPRKMAAKRSMKVCRQASGALLRQF